MAIPDVTLTVGLKDATQTGLKGIRKGLSGLGKIGGAGLKALKFGAIGAAAGIAAITAGIGGAVKGFLETGDALHKMSIRTGLAVESLSALDFAAQQSGTDIQTVEKGITRFARVIDDAGRGLATGTDVLDKLGLSFEEIKHATPEQQLRIVAQRIKALKNPTERAALAQMAFGKSGAQMIPLLEGGAAGLDDLMKQAKDTGNVMSGESAEAAAKFNDTVNTLKHSLQGVGLSVASQVVPKLQMLAEWVGVNVIPVVKNLVAEAQTHVIPILKGLAATIADPVIPKLVKFWHIFQDGVLPALQGVAAWLEETLRPIWEDVFQSAFGTVQALWKETLEPAVKDIMSLFGSDGQPTNKTLTGMFQLFKDVVTEVFQIAGIVIKNAFKVIAGLIETLVGVLRGLVHFIDALWRADWQAAWDAVKEIFSAFWDGIKGLLTTLKDTFVEIFNTLGIDIEGIWTGIWDTLREKWDGVKTFFTKTIPDGFKSMVNSIIDRLESIPNSFIGGLNSIIQAWNDFSISAPAPKVLGEEVFPSIKWNTPDIPTIPAVHLPRLGRGGIVRRPTVAVIGERGPERVEPLDEYRRRRPHPPEKMEITLRVESNDSHIQEVVNNGIQDGSITVKVSKAA